MLLAVETSCDDTALAVLDDWRVIHSEVAGQDAHHRHGGVVPEIASRLHLDVLPGMADRALDSSEISLSEIDALAATAGPGLIGSLLVGLSWTKSLAWAMDKPFLAVNHLAAHLFSCYRGPGSIVWPAVALVASGGHTCTFLMGSPSDLRLLGSTRDDAAGETFDKIAKLLGLGFPGGPGIERLAEKGDPDSIDLPSPLGDPSDPDFSFSGLKTAARLRWEAGVSPEDLCASLQRVITDLLAEKLLYQAELHQADSVVAGGGVLANRRLRELLEELCARRGLNLYLPPPAMTTDNAIMVGRAALTALHHKPESKSPISVNAFARWTGEELSTVVGLD
ncbi:tRNA (adenosine(37)-N6)-threonylcarbamoyltransferase complex transferase subunit TsaD [Candidatus Fermentibacteria bacterium]|nr:tRNA (adenosine(37)-N6)-threonylcarbamoyltransferase complex transferase subunit TsaD [Candidatus Fermentibacteria bacterium]